MHFPLADKLALKTATDLVNSRQILWLFVGGVHRQILKCHTCSLYHQFVASQNGRWKDMFLFRVKYSLWGMIEIYMGVVMNMYIT